MKEVTFNMGFKKEHSQSENWEQTEGEHFRKERKNEQKQRGGKFIMALWQKIMQSERV